MEKNIGEEETEESIEPKGQITPSQKAAKTRKEKLKAAKERFALKIEVQHLMYLNSIDHCLLISNR